MCKDDSGVDGTLENRGGFRPLGSKGHRLFWSKDVIVFVLYHQHVISLFGFQRSNNEATNR